MMPEEAIDKAMQIYRNLNPRARRTRSTAIIHSGERQTIYSCVCGSRHSVATRNRGRTKHEREWMDDHKECVIAWVMKRSGVTGE